MKIQSTVWKKLRPDEQALFTLQRPTFNNPAEIPKFPEIPEKWRLIGGILFIMIGFAVHSLLTLLFIALSVWCFYGLWQAINCSKKIRAGDFEVAIGRVTDKRAEYNRSNSNRRDHPHDPYGHPHDPYGHPHDPYGHPHDPYGHPHDPYGRPYDPYGYPPPPPPPSSRNVSRSDFNYYIFINGVKIHDKDLYWRYEIGAEIGLVIVDGMIAGIIEEW